MIAEKSNTLNLLIEQLSAKAPKVSYISNETLSSALLFLEKNGVPSNKHEDYKYCNLDAVLKKEFKNYTQDFNHAIEHKNYKLTNTYTIVVINGIYSETLSDKITEQGVTITSFSNLNEAGKKLITTLAHVEHDPFVALNTVFCAGGFFLNISKGVKVQKPIHIIYLNSANLESFLNTRNLVNLETGSTANIIEESHLVGNSKIFNNYVSEKRISEGAKLTTYFIQNEGTNAYSVNTSQVELHKNSIYENTCITLSGQVVRNNHNVVLKGEYCSAHLFGLFSSKANQLIDNHTLMDHQVPNCESNELYKGVIDDKSTGVFNGKIFVRKDAQKTNAYQSSKNILMSDDATINTKPQLEIYANDVKCSHGTSTGKIDENALFYLKTRGIGETTARKILLNSFAQEIIEKIEFEPLKEKMTELFEKQIT